MFSANNLELLFDDDIPVEHLFVAANDFPLPQRLSWLYIIANVRESPLFDDYQTALTHRMEAATYRQVDALYAQTVLPLHLCQCDVDRPALAQDIVEMTQHIAQRIRWDDLLVDPERPHYLRADALAAGLTHVTSVEAVCHSLDLDCLNVTSDSATLAINGIPVDVIADSDNYADLRLDGETRSASIALHAANFTCLTPREALELAHEIGHCRNHLSSDHPSGDFALPFWDTELPAFEEEWRLCAAQDPTLDLHAWALEAIKQSVFALFPLLAPEYGVARAYREALAHNPLYAKSTHTPTWLLEKTPLFVWTGVPYVHYFLSLAHLLLRHHPEDATLAQLLSRSYTRFTLRNRPADAA